MSPWEGAEYIIPGDEKAQPEAPGAPTPLTAAEINKAAAPKAAAPPPTPKTTESKAETGAGEPANAKAAKHSPRKQAPPAPSEPSRGAIRDEQPIGSSTSRSARPGFPHFDFLSPWEGAEYICPATRRPARGARRADAR